MVNGPGGCRRFWDRTLQGVDAIYRKTIQRPFIKEVLLAFKMGNGNGVLMGATNTKDLRQLLLPFFVNGTDRRSLQLFIALMSAVIAVSLGLSAWTIFIANGLITHFLPADLIGGLSVMVEFAGWLVNSRALAVLTVLSVLAAGFAA